MPVSRRTLLKTVAAATLFTTPAARLMAQAHGGGDGSSPRRLTPFVDPLPLPRNAIPVGSVNGCPLYRMPMEEFRHKLHRDLGASWVWGFDGSMPGPTLVGRSGEGFYVQWINRLPAAHMFEVEHRLHGPHAFHADMAAVQVPRVAVHAHGARVPPESDGYPSDYLVPPTAGPAHAAYPNQATAFYPNLQNAATLWYHDHALGMTRLNVMAGLAGFYLLQDPYERQLRLPLGPFDVPLAIQDRTFGENADHSESWLHYPETFVPEFFGDHFIVNGKVMPYLEVGRGLYRFRLLNGCNARFLDLALSTGQNFWLIATEQGLRPEPLELNHLVLGPGERAEVLIDFSDRAAGSEVRLTNAAATPYPDGAPVEHHMTQILQFRVGRQQAPGKLFPRTLVQLTTQPVDRAKVYNMLEMLDPASAVQNRRFWLFEQEPDPAGVGDFRSVIMTDAEYGRAIAATPQAGDGDWDTVVAEPVLDTIETWEFLNTTPDAHPIHLHLVQFQVIGRHNIDETGAVTGTLPLDPAELGWKDTTKVMPGEKVTIIARFSGFRGLFPVHCHILEHEDHEMMRQFRVV